MSDLTGSPAVSRPEERDLERMRFIKVGCLTFIAMVINCTLLIEHKSQISVQKIYKKF